MFERFFPRRPKERPALPEPDATLALGALLVRLAFADRTYRASEVAVIDKLLAKHFDLGPIEAAKLRATCEALERDAPGTPEFTQILHDEISYDDRRALATDMWTLIYADGKRDEIEEAVLHQIESALGITAEDSVELKQKAIGNLGSGA